MTLAAASTEGFCYNMSERKETVYVSLRTICDEMRTEEREGRAVKKPASFSSMRALLNGAFCFVDWFERLHRKEMVYGSDLPDAFRFSLETGDMLFRKPEGDRVECSEFLAPELVEQLKAGVPEEELAFSVETDRYFMAVFLFEYFFHTGSPFEGKRMVNRCFLSPFEKECFRAEQGRFCMDAGDNDNTPVKGIQDKLIHYWKEYPALLQEMFCKAFGDGGSSCAPRLTEADWKQAIVRLSMDYQSCSCGCRCFSAGLRPGGNGTFTCPGCGKTYYVLSDGTHRILLAEGVKLYACQTGRDPFDKDTVTALVVENRHKKGLYGIKNISGGVWRGLFPDGKLREIREGQGIPIWNGMQVWFETGGEWTLRLRKKEEQQTIKEDCEDEQ